MNPFKRTLVCILLILSTASLVVGQSTARVSGSRGAVEVLEQGGSVSTVQTGNNSTTTLTIGSDVTILVREQTSIEVRKLGIAPVLWIDRGNIQVSSKGSEIQVQTRSGWFTASEWPFEIGLGIDKGLTSVTVTAGALKTQNLDAAGVSFRAAGNTGVRTFSAGGNRQQDAPASNATPVYIQPVVTFGGTTNPQPPVAPTAPTVKTPATPKPPSPRN